jgi:aspartyl-tRNA(Asn)/glutamyl-tRNA(Gln) amidotransferase subunit A
VTSDELCFTPATSLVPLIRRRKVSPLEVTKAVLARIEKMNPSLNAYCTVAAEQALRSSGRSTVCRSRSRT